jgi:hypothetical protein
MTELDVMISSRLDYVGISERFLGTVCCSIMQFVACCSRYSCTGKCSWRAQRNQLELWCGVPCAPSRLQRTVMGFTWKFTCKLHLIYFFSFRRKITSCRCTCKFDVNTRKIYAKVTWKFHFYPEVNLRAHVIPITGSWLWCVLAWMNTMKFLMGL